MKICTSYMVNFLSCVPYRCIKQHSLARIYLICKVPYSSAILPIGNHQSYWYFH